MAKVERTKPGLNNEFRITYSTGAKKWTNDRPGDGVGDLEEMLADIAVQRGLDSIAKAINTGKGLKSAVDGMIRDTGTHKGKTVLNAVYKSMKSSKAADNKVKGWDSARNMVGNSSENFYNGSIDMEMSEKIAARFAGSAYEDAKKQKVRLNAIVDKLGALLEKKYPMKGGGLVPEDIRLSPAYGKDRASFDRAFKVLKDFNKMFMKKFKKEYALERKQKRDKWKRGSTMKNEELTNRVMARFANNNRLMTASEMEVYCTDCAERIASGEIEMTWGDLRELLKES